MINDHIKLTGALTITKNGKVEREVKNLVVTAGKGLVASRLSSNSASVIGYMAVGTGTTAAAAGDTTLVTELDRNALAVSGGSVSGAAITYAATWNAADGTGALTEAGLFNASSGGTLFARTVFAVVNKGADDTVTISWTVTIS
jgi:hypothetical protein|tara:strand:+ start:457 stop:888 length:432 start_codon:yes stop_codon:yes gene_type:complete